MKQERLKSELTAATCPPTVLQRAHCAYPAERLKTSHRLSKPLLFVCLLVAVIAGTTQAVMWAERPESCIGPPVLERAIESEPSVSAYDSLGQYFAQHNQVGCAVFIFEKALQVEPTSWESQYNLGIALLNSGHDVEAISHLREALQRKPGDAEISMALGSAFDRLHDPENAIGQYRLALKANPQSVPARMALGGELIAERRYNAAITLLQDSRDAGALRLLANAYRKNDDPEKAARTLQLILVLNPEDSQAHIDLGEVLQQQGDYGSAAQQFKKGMNLDPSNEYACISYLNTEVVLQQYASAAPLAAELLRTKPHDFSVVYLNGLIERNLNEDEAAETHLREAIKLNPENYEAHYSLGFVLERRFKTAQAIEQLQVALRLRPQSTEARFQLGKALRSLGKNDEAQQQFAILQQHKQEEARKALARERADQGEQALKAGEISKAIDSYHEAINQDPNNAYFYYSLALVLDRSGELQGEQEALQKSLDRNVKFAPAHNQLGYLEMQSGDFAAAEIQFKASAEIDPQYAEANNNLGVLYGKLGKAAEAKRLLLRAVEDNPDYAQAYVNLALVLASESKFAEAKVALDSALKLTPLDPSALRIQKLVEAQLKH
jgi:tetratricopeptide (TPR) repeat protein